MAFSRGHFHYPALELIRLAQIAALGFGSSTDLRQHQRIADGYVRDMEELWRQLDSDPSELPSPPSGIDLFVPAPLNNWRQVGAETWLGAFRKTIADLVTKSREMVNRCWELSPTPLAGTDHDEGSVRNYNEAAQRACLAHGEFEADVMALLNRLREFDQQAERFPRQTAPSHAPSPPREGTLPPNPDKRNQSQEQNSPRFHEWAFGKEHGGKWHVFRKIGGTWRAEGLLRGLRRGLQDRLMEAFAEGGGYLAMRDVMKREAPECPAAERKKIKGKISSELTNIRKTLLAGMGVPKRTADPLPHEPSGDRSGGGWRARVSIGYAVQEDGNTVGGEHRLRFKTKGELTMHEELDS
jgi:hypothetical protein